MIEYCQPAGEIRDFLTNHVSLLARSTGSVAAGPGVQRPGSLAFDFKQAVVFGEALGLRDRSDLDLITAPAHREVGQPIVFGFAAAGADRHLPSSGARKPAGMRSLG